MLPSYRKCTLCNEVKEKEQNFVLQEWKCDSCAGREPSARPQLLVAVPFLQEEEESATPVEATLESVSDPASPIDSAHLCEDRWHCQDCHHSMIMYRRRSKIFDCDSGEEETQMDPDLPPQFDFTAWVSHLYLAGESVLDLDRKAMRKALLAVHKAWPSALPNPVLMALLKKMLITQGDMDAEGTLMGSSICPDEICHEAGGLAQLLQEMWGENFHFGGLAGIPFVGKAGFGAFAHHVPENGHIFLIVAPHVGVSRDGELGMYCRLGQVHASTACGAAVAALRHIQSGKPIPSDRADEYLLDHQLHYIMKVVQQQLPAIEADPKGEMVGLARAMFDFAFRLMMNSINMKLLHGGTLVLLGGLQLNMPKPLDDFFAPMVFQKMREGQETVDLLPQLLQPL